MNSTKRSLLQERLSGIEFRNKQRELRRQLYRENRMERKRMGIATREYYIYREKRA